MIRNFSYLKRHTHVPMMHPVATNDALVIKSWQYDLPLRCGVYVTTWIKL